MTERIALAAVLAAGPAWAQDSAPSAASPRPVAGASYGTDNQQVSIVSSSAMVPVDNDESFSKVGGFLVGTALFEAPIQGLVPNGARLESVCMYGWDVANGQSNMRLRLVRDVVDSSNGHNAGRYQMLELQSEDGSDGTSVWCANDFSLPIIYRYDWDNDGDWQNLAYSLELDLTPGAGFQMVRLLWRRAVRPDPDSSTFLDVPTGSAYHRWVEALASAGVTHGCDASHYCPNDPVTRGQLAYMLARALGLDWPAYGVGYVP